MKIAFNTKDRQKVLAAVQAAMGGRELAKLVTFALKDKSLEVTISKFGTSTLRFDEHETESALHYTLTSEKIALAHRPLKDDVTRKILEVIAKAGGKQLA